MFAVLSLASAGGRHGAGDVRYGRNLSVIFRSHNLWLFFSRPPISYVRAMFGIQRTPVLSTGPAGRHHGTKTHHSLQILWNLL
jgi:hypothetical protein